MRILKILNKTILVVASLIYSLSLSAQSTSCNALVDIRSDIWLATQKGELQKQLTYDGKLKDTIAVSPNGKVIAYSGEQSGNSVTLMDSNGIHLADLYPKVEDAITSLAWTSPDTLTIGQHISPVASKFFFMRVPTNPFSNHFSEIAPPIRANGCAASPQGKDVACFMGGALIVNEREVYSPADPYVGAEKIQSFNLAIGSVAETTTTPVFRIQILEIKNGVIDIKVTNNDDNWSEYYQKNGDIGPMNYYRELIDASHPLFGLQTNFDKPDAKTALLTVVKSLDGDTSFDTNPIWSPSGKRIAFVEATETGKRALVLVKKDGDDSSNGSVDGRIVLPSETPVGSLTFTSNTHIVIQSGTGVQLDVDIPEHGKVPTTARFVVSSSLPPEISILNKPSLGPVQVIHWICPEANPDRDNAQKKGDSSKK